MSLRSDSVQYANASDYLRMLKGEKVLGEDNNIYEIPENSGEDAGSDQMGEHRYQAVVPFPTPRSAQGHVDDHLEDEGHNTTKAVSRRLTCACVWLGLLTVLVLGSLGLGVYTTHCVITNQLTAVSTSQTSPLGNGSSELLATGLERGKINIALGKRAFQSTTYAQSDNNASNAVDGDFRADMNGHCIHTDHEESPWWKVDLGAIYPISSISVTGRGNGVKDCRNNNLEIRVGRHSKHSSNALCFYFHGNLGRGVTRVFRCNADISGRWVSIQRVVSIPGGYLGIPHPTYNDTIGCSTREPLEICEVQIYSLDKGAL